MKLRIIHVDSPNRLAGIYIVQERRWLSWEDLYFDKKADSLVRDMMLGNMDIVLASFGDWHMAKKLADAFKTTKRVIREVWHI